MDDKGFDYLNVIPLVDVMLVLLTIVLTTSTFIATGGIKVQLPKADAVQNTTALHPLTISIGKDRTIWIDAREIAPAGLADALAKVDLSTPLLVRADKDIPLQLFVDVYGPIRQLGFTTISLQTEQQP